MLSPSTHPAGSQAMLRGTPGTIRQWLADGVAVFFPQRGQPYHADAGELDPVPALPPFEAWAAERIVRVQGFAVTRAADVFEDYLDWCDVHQVDEGERLKRWHFAPRMRSAGYEMTKRPLALKEDGPRYLCNVWKLALQPTPVARAA